MAVGWERFLEKTMHGNVVLNFTSHPMGELHGYTRAYQNAANSLVEVFRGKVGYSDLEACPIVFLYRHSIELYLRAILLWGGGLLRLQKGKELDLDDLFRTHEFKRLLPVVKRVFEVAGWLIPAEGLPKYGTYPEMESLIMEFVEIDARSFAFRYPINTKGEAHLPDSFHFNVVKLGEELDQVLSMLDGATMGVYEQFQFLAREYASMR